MLLLKPNSRRPAVNWPHLHKLIAVYCRGWCQLPVYNFVNGLDIVPRLLGDTSISAVVKVGRLAAQDSSNDLNRHHRVY